MIQFYLLYRMSAHEIQHGLSCRSAWSAAALLRLMLLAVLGVGLSLFSSVAVAQVDSPFDTSNPAADIPAEPSNDTAASSGSQIPQDIVYIPDADGRLRPVPMNVTLQEFLEWLERRDQADSPDQAEWTIRSLEASGTLKTSANGSTWAEMTCQLNVQTGQSPQWHSLPLMLGEGLLAGMTDSEQETASSQIMVARDVDSGQWLLWYRDRKAFTVTLDLLVPIRTTGEQSQLTLTTPLAARTELQLALNRTDLKVDLLSRGFLEKDIADEKTSIRVAGFQQAVDLRWTPDRPDNTTEPIMNVDSQIEVSRGTESTVVTARQKLTLDRGSVNQVRVKLPTGFQVDTVTADVPMRYAMEATDPSFITLTFTQPVQSAVQIDWKLSSPVRRFETQLLIDGFAITDARTQTGKIGVLRSNEWRIGQIPDRSENIYEMNVRDIPMMGDYVKAYRYYGQPYRLLLSTQRAESQYSHSSFYQLKADEDSLRLTLDFEVTPRNGVLDAVRMEWPDLNSGEWIPERIVRQSTGKQISWEIEGDDRLLVPLDPPVSQTETIRVEATRSLDNLDRLLSSGDSFPVALPQISLAESALKSRVINVANSLFLPWEMMIDSEQAELMANSAVPGEWLERPVYQRRQGQTLRSRWYRLGGQNETLPLRFRPVKQELAAQSIVELEQIDLAHRRLTYSQRVSLNVSHLPLDELVFEQPTDPFDSEREQLRFSDGEGNSLVPEEILDAEPIGGVEQSTATGRQYIFRPKAAILGNYTIVVHRDIPFEWSKDAETVSVSLPLVRVSGADTLSTQFANLAAYEVELPRDNWRLVEVLQGTALWRTTTGASELPLTARVLEPRLVDLSGPIEAQVQSWLSGNGGIVSEMKFEIARTPPAFVVEQGEDFEILSAYWLSAEQNQMVVAHVEEQGGRSTVVVKPVAVGQPGKLIVAVRHHSHSPLHSLSGHQLRLPDHSFADRLSLVNWTLNFPQGTYLLGKPSGFTACYEWTWQLLGFRRLDTQTFSSDSSAVVKQTVGPHPAYRFATVGWPETMRIRVIGRGLLMTLGTGLPIILAILFSGQSLVYRLRGGLLCVLAIGLWGIFFPEPFFLLLQPALLGLVFALIAMGLARRLRRHHDEPTLIIVGPNAEQGPTGSSLSIMSEHNVNADDITRVQPPQQQQAVSSSHS